MGSNYNFLKHVFLGNSNLIYSIIRKRQVFYQLSNLSTDAISIAQNIKKNKNTKTPSPTITKNEKDLTDLTESSPTTEIENSLVNLTIGNNC